MNLLHSLTAMNNPSPPANAQPMTDKGSRELLVAERRRLIREMADAQERVTVDELVERFGTSAVTIRSDLNALAQAGVLVRTHGGALAQREGDDVPLTVKQSQHHAQKVRIAAAAVKLIQDGETIILDSGTTTAELAKQIRSSPLRGLNVITNALNVAVALAQASNVNLIMPGGVLRPRSYSLGGPLAERALQGLHADRLFLGVDSLDPQIGLMTPHMLEAQLNAQMIRISRQIIAVADSSKLMRRSLSVIAKVEEIHTLVSDTGADPQVVRELRGRGVEVVLA